jgi:hypothetical protein
MSDGAKERAMPEKRSGSMGRVGDLPYDLLAMLQSKAALLGRRSFACDITSAKN